MPNWDPDGFGRDSSPITRNRVKGRSHWLCGISLHRHSFLIFPEGSALS